MKQRFYYFLLILIVISLGLLSRKLAFIPFIVGDFLYGCVAYLGIRFLFIDYNKTFALSSSIIFCYAIEFLQLSNVPWLLNLRQTTFGIYVLGSGFIWSDILAYTLGILIVYLIDKRKHNA